MLEFISKNYDWLFSGIGVVIILTIIRWLKKGTNEQEKALKGEKIKILNKKVQDSTKTHSINSLSNSVQSKNTLSNSDNNVIISGEQIQNIQIFPSKTEYKEISSIIDIEPITIKNEIESVPLLQRDHIGSIYEGIKIKWILPLFMIHSRGNNKIGVVFNAAETAYPKINIDTDLDKHPFFKIAKDKDLFEIEGKIIKCSAYDIEVEVTSVKYLRN
jgi:hypothetical protein